MRFVQDNKRIIILDCDLTEFPSDKWNIIMKRVLGRHYANIKKKGPGWTFATRFLDTFESLLQKIEHSSTTNISIINEKESTDSLIAIDEKQESSTDTAISDDIAIDEKQESSTDTAISDDIAISDTKKEEINNVISTSPVKQTQVMNENKSVQTHTPRTIVFMEKQTQTVSTSTMVEKNIANNVDKFTQTEDIRLIPRIFPEIPVYYKYNVDQGLMDFCRKWIE